jgi:preprotein translocase subunit SecF
MADNNNPVPKTAPDHESFATRLYRGEVSYDFIGSRKRWYAASGVVMLISVLSILIRGLHPSIDFKGGAVFQFPVHGHTISDVRNAVTAAGVTPEVVTITGSGSAARFRVETKALVQTTTNDQVKKVEVSLEQNIGITEQDITSTTVGSTWGSQITKKAVYGLIVFLIAVIIYLSFRFEWKMALAAIVALLHDLLITAGIYSLVGFEVSPSTVIALLTILGYSLYDTVVVFDKVRENTVGILGGSRMTFSQAANLAVNQTLVRSINTSLVALIPVGAILYVGAVQLGSGTLKDLALALFVGMAAGAYSSIFIATPLLAHMKSLEPDVQELEKRLKARRRHEADRYASVPAFTDDLPIASEPGSGPLGRGDREEQPAAAGSTGNRPRPSTEPSGRGRVVPESRAPVRPSSSSRRAQPTRQPRSKRGKK